MSRLAALVLVFACVASAQDRAIKVSEKKVQVQQATFTKTPDGGCDVVAGFSAESMRALLDDSIVPQPRRHPASASTCERVFGSALKAAKLDLKVGDGGTP